MCSYPELIKCEDELKEKYFGILRTMSHLELKKFSMGKYQEKLLKELKQKFPTNNNETQLSETAQCIANALDREAASQTKSRARESASVKKVSALLSDTVIADLDTTLQVDITQGNGITASPNHKCDDFNEGNDSGEETESESETDMQQDHDPNTSITQLKQVSKSKNKSTGRLKTTKSSQSYTNQYMCIQTCKIKQNSKKKQYDMTRCTLCMLWCHDKCVGFLKEELIGVWFCPSCRHSQQVLLNDVSGLKTEVKTIRDCTDSILTAINGLSTKLENSVGEIHDKIAALSNQIKSNDVSVSDSIENLTVTTNTIKITVEEKADQILNKTKAVFDKMKTQIGGGKNQNQPSKPAPRNNVQLPSNVPSKTSNIQKKENNANQQIQQTTKPKYKRVQRNKPSAPNLEQQRRDQTTKPSRKTDNNETIDLTTDNIKPITQSTLLVGSSILKGVRVQDLKTDTAVRSFSGARVDTIGAKLSKYNIEECKTLILHVGGNDADSGVDLESFEDNYVSLLNDLSADDRRIIVSGLTPRESVDLKPFNRTLKSICEENDLQFIDNYDRFLLASGEMPESYFQDDKTHLNVSGTRKLLTNIDAVHRVT